MAPHSSTLAWKIPWMECKVKRALGSITMNKASGGDGIPVELFQILKPSPGAPRAPRPIPLPFRRCSRPAALSPSRLPALLGVRPHPAPRARFLLPHPAPGPVPRVPLLAALQLSERPAPGVLALRPGRAFEGMSIEEKNSLSERLTVLSNLYATVTVSQISLE